MSSGPQNLLEALLSGRPWVKGEWHKRLAGSRRSFFLEIEDADEDRLLAELDAVIGFLESPIEQIAIHQLVGRNYAPLRYLPSYAAVRAALPEEWPDGVAVIFVPQVEAGRYRVDFMAHLKSGKKFAVECDGAEFHDAIRDGVRDSSLLRHQGVTVLRFTGEEIWESPLWTNQVCKMVHMMGGGR